MSTITKTFLTGTSSEGFVLSGYSNWTSIYSSSGTVVAYEIPVEGNATYSGILYQSSSINTYEDLGVPSGANILGIKFLGMSSFIVQDANGFLNLATASFYIEEAFLGTFDVGLLQEGSYIDLTSSSLNSADEIRLSIELVAETGIDISEFPSYGAIELQIYDFSIEVTYELIKKNKMFFAL
jgi:hypothetical protein